MSRLPGLTGVGPPQAPVLRPVDGDHRSAAPGLVLVDGRYDQRVRWRPGTRLEHVFEARCDELQDAGPSAQPAVDTGDEVLTYAELDGRANRLARHLIGAGVRPGQRVGLLFHHPVEALVATLGVLKAHAAYVPLDPAFPRERLSYIVDDAAVTLVLSESPLRPLLHGTASPTLCVDECAAAVAARDDERLTAAERPAPDNADDLCYVIYTSGSTGRPKGVAVEHASICNFVLVAAEVYGVEAGDRMYQGMTIAFDFSVEEIWVALAVGATLVPKPPGATLVGPDLARFLESRRVTALCCVPTLLATLEEDLPGLRFLLVSGEACPQDLIGRWHRPGRRFLNVYGPTETTVSATWAVVDPNRGVTIGVPLPTYSVVILDPDGGGALPPGEAGEIGIAGIGLARGYLNRDDLTARAFVPDFLALVGNPSGRIYRTGDLGRVNADGEIEYLGRIDSQVKIRGYRIELTEIESALLEAPGVAQAVVTTHEPEPGMVELAAYYSRRTDAAEVDPAEVYGRLRQRLPRYMVPAYLEELPRIPMLPSGKADRKSLPPPSGPRHAGERRAYTAPATDAERRLAEALGAALRVEAPSVESHFFDDLGADSLLMARFCAEVRRRTGADPVSMQEVYLHPTVRRLAAALDGVATGAPDATAGAGQESGAAPPPGPGGRPGAEPTRAVAATAAYVACGAAQLAFFVAWLALHVLVVTRGVGWIAAADAFADTWRRSVVFTAAGFAVFTTLPVAGKWLLVGRFGEESFPAWGPAYLRFWLVKTLIRGNPMVLFVGSPLYGVYLRALGARVGRGVLILSRRVPVCTDLLTVGDGTVIHKEASFSCYRARAGRIETGPVTLGTGVLVGEESVLDIGTSMGDGAQLGHSSSLPRGAHVPAGARVAGSPAQPTDADYRAVAPGTGGAARRVTFSVAQLADVLLLFGPLAVAAVVWAGEQVPPIVALVTGDHPSLTDADFYAETLVVSGVVFAGGVFAGLVSVLAAAHLLRPLLRPGRVYPLYGLSYWALRAIGRLTNIRFYLSLFGDSSAIVYYLQALGYRLAPVHQTGSNFGVEVRHDVPHLCAVGTGTMCSDGLSFANAEFSSTGFRVSPVTIGPGNFVGNSLVYPPTGRTGHNCLLATKVMVPVHGPVREGVGLLGAPPFEIPRSVPRDRSVAAPRDDAELRARLQAKNRHNAATMGLFLLTRWFYLFGLTVFVAPAAALDRLLGPLGTTAAVALAVPGSVAYWVLVDRACAAHAALQPRLCSIYDVAFWRHERYWKVPTMAYAMMFNGTPFKNLIWRALGARVGRRCFDDGAWLTERTLVSIGDDCTFNAGSDLQGHSLEDGVFKSDRITVGSRCTVGTKGFIHYGTVLHDGVTVEADAFVMKGEEVPPGATWRGNPARRVRPGPALPGPSPLLRVEATPGVRVSLFSLAEHLPQRDGLLALLDDAERDEFRRLRSGRRRDEFVASRALPRLVLSAEWAPGTDPRAWRIGRDGRGKPVVLGGVGGGPAPGVSIAHAGGVVAVATSDTLDVGVDVEPARDASCDGVVWSALSPAERRRLAAAPPGERPGLFLRMWTLKEAFAKCRGDGAALPFDRMTVTLDPPAVTVDDDGTGGAEPRPIRYHQQLYDAGSAGMYWVAVAAARRPQPGRAGRLV